MGIILFYFICLAIISIFFRKSKFLTLISFISLFAIAYFNYANADYEMYRFFYEIIGENTAYFRDEIEIFFQILIKICYNLGFSFEIFRGVIYLISLSLILNTILKYSKAPALCAIAYAIMPFTLDVVQLRFFLSSSIVIFALRYLIDEEKYSRVKFIILLIIASLFQRIVLVFAILILMDKLEKKNYIRLFIWTFILVVLIKSNIFLTILSKIIPSRKINQYFLESSEWRTSFTEFIYCMIVQIIINITYIFLYKYKKDIYREAGIEIKNRYLLDRIESINYFSIIIMPLYLYLSEFLRLTRIILVINSIGMTNMIEKKLTKSGLIVITIVVLYAIIVFILLINRFSLLDKTFYSILKYNLL